MGERELRIVLNSLGYKWPLIKKSKINEIKNIIDTVLSEEHVYTGSAIQEACIEVRANMIEQIPEHMI